MSFSNFFHFAALILFHGIVGFGPGLIIGLFIGNRLAARDQRTIAQKQASDITVANQHNRQWHPSHERWQSKH